MSIDVREMINRIKAHPDYARVGMILTHVGIVRGHSRNGKAVSGLDLTVDHEALETILAEHRSRPGIVEILVEITEGSLILGEEVMALVVAGEVRDQVIPTLEDTLNAIKRDVTAKTEHFV